MRRESSSATWSSREVNDVSHQNRALLPLVAALTGKLMRPSPRSGALPPHAVWPRPQGAMHGFGGICHSPFGMTTLQRCFRAALRRAMPPGAAWRFSLGRHTRFFGQDQRNGVAKGSARACPCSAPRRFAPRYATGRMAGPRREAPRYASRRSLVSRRSGCVSPARPGRRRPCRSGQTPLSRSWRSSGC